MGQTHQFVVCADDVNLLGENIIDIEVLVDARKEVNGEVRHKKIC